MANRTARDAKLTRMLRMVVWGGAVVAWLIPLAATLFAGLPWTPFDFIAWGVMLGVAAGLAELGLRLSGQLAYRAGVIVAVGTSFLITWSNLAVGIIGNENNPLNQIFFAVIAIAIVGACVARFRAKGMALAMVVTAAAQFGTGFVALAYEHIVFAIVGVFSLGWLLAAWLFREAARGEARVQAASALVE
ncbi:signal transduction histidine kinase [Brevundimonas alba]|uniref:Signal transduction histidine kinase n=1 Tax=Brevundimonas alba TaxID=74314 RepID=A0A7X5YIS1_9CAUL|nr:hypothetical protein [Brevundimonas alba]NJC40409.1 signal transduction histidine kinase [Brevundimonas alba]